jgi:hypothetical protein
MIPDCHENSATSSIRSINRNHPFDRGDTKTRVLIALTDGNDTSSRISPGRAAEIVAGNGIDRFGRRLPLRHQEPLNPGLPKRSDLG